jgi:integrase
MPQPFKSRHGVYYYRKVVPESLRPAVGKREIRVSLETKDPNEAKRRYAAAAARAEVMLSAARTGPVSLTNQQIEALAGTFYRRELATWSPNPGSADNWEAASEAMPSGESPFDEQARAALMDPLVTELTRAEGITLDDTTRKALHEALTVRSIQLYDRLARRAHGDYSPDPVLAQFPEWKPLFRAAPTDDEASVMGWFDKWADERKPKQKTRMEWRRYVENFVAFLGHDRIADVRRQHVLRWKDDLVKRGFAPAGVATKLAPVKKVFAYWADNCADDEATNPTARVRVDYGREGGNEKRAYTDDEAQRILLWARKQKNPFWRYAPFLQAYGGMRIGEVVQLRVADVVQIAGHWTVRISRAGGRSTKNKNSIRTVPLNRYVREEGFLEYVATLPQDGFVFPRAAKTDSRGTIGGKAKELLAAAIRRDLCIDDNEVAPTHSWRHRLRDLCRNHGIPDEAGRVLQGWAPRDVADGYGNGYYIQTLAGMLDLLPRQCPAVVTV